MKQILFHFHPQKLALAAVICSYLSFLALPLFTNLALSPNHSSSNFTTRQLPILSSSEDLSETQPEKEIQNDLEPEPDGSEDDSPTIPDSSDPSEEPYEFPYPIIIKAIHPGYKIDGVSDVGELIELQNLSDAPLSLAGFSLRYTNSSGKKVTILEFAEGSLMTGETLLLRYYKSPEHAASDLNYRTSLAMSAGPLELIAAETIIDSVCWTGKNDCAKPFKSATPTTLVRDLFSGEFTHEESYTPTFDPSVPSYYAPPEEPEKDPNEAEETGTPQCFMLEFSEIYSYYDSDQPEQFIELHNPSSSGVSLNGCQIRYKKKLYDLSGSISPDGYFAFYPSDQFSLTKNPSSKVSIELIDADGSIVEEISYPKGQKKATSYALFYDNEGRESWSQTYTPTPGQPNSYQANRTCEAGKVINPLTGNCVKASNLKSGNTVCPAGKYLNPLTGRCKSISTSTNSLKPCAEGYERNPETNRCRKIVSANDGAEHALVPATRSDNKIFIGFGIVALLVSAGIVYIILQFRREIARAVRKICQRLNRIFQDLLAGKIGLHRHKKP